MIRTNITFVLKVSGHCQYSSLCHLETNCFCSSSGPGATVGGCWGADLVLSTASQQKATLCPRQHPLSHPWDIWLFCVGPPLRQANIREVVPHGSHPGLPGWSSCCLASWDGCHGLWVRVLFLYTFCSFVYPSLQAWRWEQSLACCSYPTSVLFPFNLCHTQTTSAVLHNKKKLPRFQSFQK